MLTADAFLRSGKVRDLFELPDGRLLLVAIGPDQRLRRRAADRDPGQGPGPDRPVAVLVRRDGRRSSPTTCSTSTSRSQDAWEAAIADAASRRPGRSTSRTSRRGAGGSWSAGRPRSSRSRPSSAASSPARAGRSTRRPATSAASALPPGLRESDRLPEPIFTPATKAPEGEHDQNIDFDGMVRHIGRAVVARPEAAGRAGRGRPRPVARAVPLRRRDRRADRDPHRRHEVRVRPATPRPASCSSSTRC